MPVSTATTSAGALTQAAVAKILIRPLQQASVFLAAGPQVFVSDGSPIRLPKLGGPVNPAWHGEGELISEQDVAFSEITLLPSTLKSVKTLTRFSNELARQSVIALDAALQERLVTDVASALDTQFLSATGDGITLPKGLFAWTGVQTLAVNAALSLDALHDAEGLALGANVNPANLKWVMRSRELVRLRKIKATDGSYIVQPNVTEAGGYSLLGHPVVLSSRIPDTTATPPTARAALVDFSQVAVGQDQSPSVKLLDQTFGAYDQQALRVTARYDSAPMNPEAVVRLSGLTV